MPIGRRRRRSILAAKATIAVGAALVVLVSFVSRPTRAFVTPTFRSRLVEIAGAYVVTGTDLKGDPGPGDTDGSLTKVAVDVYLLRETSKVGTYDGVCLRTGMHLACSWGLESPSLGIATFRAGRDAWEGRWVANVVTPATMQRPARVRWEIPGGARYGSWPTMVSIDPSTPAIAGTVAVAALVTGPRPIDAVKILWTASGVSEIGFAMEMDGLIDVAHCVTGPCGIVHYRIDPGGRRLEGRWMSPWDPNGGVGIDILTRK